MPRTSLADAASALVANLSDEDVLTDGATDHNPHDWLTLVGAADDDGKDYVVHGQAIYPVRDDFLGTIPVVQVRRVDP